jgi:hypothetical protein
MKRRAFLAGFGASIGALTTVSYFDMGASWKKHGDLYALDLNDASIEDVDNYFDGIDRSVHPFSVFEKRSMDSLERLLKEYYNDRTVANLTFSGSAELFARMR